MKKFVIISAVVVALAVLLLIFVFFQLKSGNTVIPDGESDTNDVWDFPFFGNRDSSSQDVGNTATTTQPSGLSATSSGGIGTVPAYVRRIKEQALPPSEAWQTGLVALDELGDYQIALTDDYTIYFGEQYNRLFIITLQSQPLGYARKLAEEKLLEILQLPKDEVCQLNITVNTTGEVEKGELKPNYGLSFCPGHESLNELKP